MNNQDQGFDQKDQAKYVHVGKKPKMMPVSVAICIMIVCTVFSILITFSLCTVHLVGLSNNSTPSGDVNINTDDLEVPSYFKDVVVLDEIFKTYSFDGIDEEKMGEAMLDAYISATGDIYAEYLNAEEYAAYFEERKGEFVGIGVSIVNSEITVSGYTYTNALAKRSAAPGIFS